MTGRLRSLEAAPVLGAVLAAALVGAQFPHRPIIATAAIVVPLVVALAVLRIDAAYALLIASALILPAVVGYKAWLLALVLVVGVGFLHGLARADGLVVPLPFVAYTAVYGLAMLHGDWEAFDITEAGKYVFFPLLALATASVATDPEIRRRLVAMMILAGVAQLPVAAVQSANVVLTYGNRLWGVDTVTGLVQSRGAGALALVTVAVGALCLALSIEGVWRPRVLAATAVALAFVGVLSGSRGVYAFVPAAFLPLVGGYLVFGERADRSRRIAGFVALSLAILPALVLAMGTLYPGANAPVRGADSLNTYLQDTTPSAGTLPNRGAQLRIAVDLSAQRSADEALLGMGVGTTRFDASRGYATPKSDPLVIGIEQRTNGVWVPRLITETGYLGFAAFIGLLLYLLSVARRGYRTTSRHTLDRALIVALPGLVGLTFIGAFYNTALAVQPFATILWIVVGLCLAIDRATSVPGHEQRRPLPAVVSTRGEA